MSLERDSVQFDNHHNPKHPTHQHQLFHQNEMQLYHGDNRNLGSHTDTTFSTTESSYPSLLHPRFVQQEADQEMMTEEESNLLFQHPSPNNTPDSSSEDLIFNEVSIDDDDTVVGGNSNCHALPALCGIDADQVDINTPRRFLLSSWDKLETYLLGNKQFNNWNGTASRQEVYKKKRPRSSSRTHRNDEDSTASKSSSDSDDQDFWGPGPISRRASKAKSKPSPSSRTTTDARHLLLRHLSKNNQQQEPQRAFV